MAPIVIIAFVIFAVFLYFVQNDISVRQNGIQYGFKVLIISTDDNEWDQKVLDEARRIARLKEKPQASY